MSAMEDRAVELIDSLHEWQAEQGQTDTTMITVAIEALTLASISAANQHRIENQIASLELTFTDELLDADKREMRICSTLRDIQKGLSA